MRAFVLALLVVLAAEGAARMLITTDDWRYWGPTPAVKQEMLDQMITREGVPDVLFLGDSTAAYDFRPKSFDEASGLRSFNMGVPGNVPLAFDASIRMGLLSELEQQPRFYVVSFVPTGFFHVAWVERVEQSILTSPISRSNRGLHVWGDYIAMARAQGNWRIGSTRSYVHPMVYNEAGFEDITLIEKARPRTRLEKVLPLAPLRLTQTRHHPDRVSFAERLQALANLVSHARDNDVQLIITIPRLRRSELKRRRFQRFKTAVNRLGRANGVPIWDYSSSKFPLAIGNHMGQEGASEFSAHLGRRITRDFPN
jgi:hypothetical protein